MMAKLYWRVKRNGKWTWRPAKSMQEIPSDNKGIKKETDKYTIVWNLEVEE